MPTGIELVFSVFGLLVLSVLAVFMLGAWGMAKAYRQEFREEKQASKLALRIQKPNRQCSRVVKPAPEVLAA